MIPAPLISRLEQLTLVSRHRPSSGLHGERQSRALGSSLEFADYREYVPGDDLRRIDWNLYGRTNSLFVKQFEAQQMLPVYILVDDSGSMDFGEPTKGQLARQIAAGLGYVALANYDQVTVAALDAEGDSAATVRFGPDWGRIRSPALFAAIADRIDPPDATASRTTDLAAALASFFRRNPRPGLTVLISDLLSPTWEDGLRLVIGTRSDVVVLHVLAPEELDPEAAEEVRLVDRETNRTVEVRLDQAAISRYRQRLRQWCEAIEAHCRRNGVRYLRLSSATPPHEALLGRLTRAGVLR